MMFFHVLKNAVQVCNLRTVSALKVSAVFSASLLSVLLPLSMEVFITLFLLLFANDFEE